MSKVLGKNVVVFINDGGIWKVYACAKSATLILNTDFVETSISGQGVFATYLPTKNSFTGTLEGVTSLEEEGKLSLPDLRQRQITQQLIMMRFQRTDSDSHVYTDEASFYISSSTDVGSFDDMNLFTIELRGTGSLTQVFTPTPIFPPGCVGVTRAEYTGIGDETFFVADGTNASVIADGSNADIRGKEILEANKDGIGFKVILSGTPVGKEVKYTSASGRFDWSIPYAPGEEAYILYQ